MFTNSVLAVTGALLSVVAAVPMAGHHQHHHKREYVWETHTQVDVVTVPVTKTVWMDPGETPPVEKPHGYGPQSSASSADVEPAATSAPAPPAYTPESSSSPAAAPSSPESSAEAPTSYAAPTTSSSSSVYVAPTPTTPTSTYVAPTPTTYAAPTTSASSPAAYSPPQSSAASGGSSGGSGLSSGLGASGTTYTGDLTWYEVGLGACGWTNTQSEAIVAVAESIFDSYNNGNPNKNPLCGKYVSITGKDGSQYRAKIVDRCPGCAEADLDLSQDFFNTCTSNGDGRVSGMKWEFE